MALVRTTLSSAVAATDTSIVVASATGFSAGYILQVDQEVMKVGQTYTSGTTIPVLRGQDGTVVGAHVSSAGVVAGTASDWSSPAAQTTVQFPIAGKARTIISYSAAGAITLPTPGADAVAILNGTSVLAMTVAAPSKDMDGCVLWIASNGAAAHTVTFTGGLSGASTSYDVITVNASAPVLLGPFMAVNSLWQAAVAVPMAGTVTNITATVA
jgi:hypothetical protein